MRRQCALSIRRKPFRARCDAFGQERSAVRCRYPWQGTRRLTSEVHSKELFEFVRDVVQLLLAQRREGAQPEGLVHYYVGVGQLAADTEVAPGHVRLLGQVAGK